MKLRLNITDENGSRQYDSTEVNELRDAADLLLSIAAEHDPEARHKPTSFGRVTRVDLTWEV